jgi:phage baseplate assembly protein W
VTIDLGTDLSTPDGMDLDPLGGVVSGRRAVGQAIARRLVTPRGGLLDDESYGYDLRQLVGEALRPGDLATVEAEIADQCRADERVDDVAVAVTLAATGALRVELTIATETLGPLRLVLAVSAVSAEILALETL